MEAAKGNRYGRRDATMVLVAYRHGLRAAEVVDHWDQVDFRTATLHVRRVKKGTPSTHPSATNYAPCGGSSANRSPSRRSCSPRSGERRSPRQGLRKAC
jgi:integrase